MAWGGWDRECLALGPGIRVVHSVAADNRANPEKPLVLIRPT
jgi:hypothetical protein